MALTLLGKSGFWRVSALKCIVGALQCRPEENMLSHTLAKQTTNAKGRR